MTNIQTSASFRSFYNQQVHVVPSHDIELEPGYSTMEKSIAYVIKSPHLGNSNLEQQPVLKIFMII